MMTAYFAGGCFWGVEALFQQVHGVTGTTAGYMGGTKDNPTYLEVCSDKTGHAETVLVEYDENILQYQDLLEIFFGNHNPTEYMKQGEDTGSQYRSVIFYTSPEQKETALQYIKKIDSSGKYDRPVVTEVVKAGIFWPADDCHQSYYMKIAMRYGQDLY